MDSGYNDYINKECYAYYIAPESDVLSGATFYLYIENYRKKCKEKCKKRKEKIFWKVLTRKGKSARIVIVGIFGTRRRRKV